MDHHHECTHWDIVAEEASDVLRYQVRRCVQCGALQQDYRMVEGCRTQADFARAVRRLWPQQRSRCD